MIEIKTVSALRISEFAQRVGGCNGHSSNNTLPTMKYYSLCLRIQNSFGIASDLHFTFSSRYKINLLL